MIVLDTSVLVDSLTGEKRSSPALRRVYERGERVILPALVYYEWLRGPRLPQELALAERLFPRESAIVFGPAEAAVSAKLYRSVRRPCGREMDLAIAACAIRRLSNGSVVSRKFPDEAFHFGGLARSAGPGLSGADFGAPPRTIARPVRRQLQQDADRVANISLHARVIGQQVVRFV